MRSSPTSRPGFRRAHRLVRRAIDTAEARRVQLRQLGVGRDDLQPTVNYLATLRVLRDLILQGWMPGSDDDGIYILPPTLTAAGEDPSEAKSDLRNSFRFAVADQLLSPSVAAFIAKMERNGVAALFADGPDLAERIEQAAATTGIPSRRSDLSSKWSRPMREIPTRASVSRTSGGMHAFSGPSHTSPRPAGTCTTSSATRQVRTGPSSASPPWAMPSSVSPSATTLSGWSVLSLAHRLDSASTREQRKIVRHLLDFIHAEAERIYVDDFDLEGLSLRESASRTSMGSKHAADRHGRGRSRLPATSGPPSMTSSVRRTIRSRMAVPTRSTGSPWRRHSCTGASAPRTWPTHSGRSPSSSEAGSHEDPSRTARTAVDRGRSASSRDRASPDQAAGDRRERHGDHHLRCRVAVSAAARREARRHAHDQPSGGAGRQAGVTRARSA